MQQPEQQQQHPFSYIFVGRRTFYLFSSIKDILRLRATCTWLSRDLFGAAQLRDRLRHSLGSQAGLRRAVNGQQVQLLRFDDDQLGTHDLLAAVCVMEEGPWGEMGEVIELAGQCGNCDLPVILTFDDINAHANKTTYVSAPRVLAQLKMVDPPLPAGHLYQQHWQPHDPPVRESIYYSSCNDADRWQSDRVFFGGQGIDASASSFAKAMILDYFEETHQINDASIGLNRYVGGGRLHDLLIRSPHTPVAGCTSTLSQNGRVRRLVLIDGSHPFVAWIEIGPDVGVHGDH
ncbi:unnamed protein product [Vitrella brassicaformis CCMP3155]|uniref:Uncharacterized protein n=1 Tax=Vitrella brassicaformis (strain CCMP3155) TaxID=1169540 RepID=A0A0G4EYZ4_VITBC|nr:unnamed protein product [Vitrella brassicaformis CCMP3155]|eukprot:CEM04403.1 unnamed protein product [Vitrella brassicaformis CCMP3155]